MPRQHPRESLVSTARSDLSGTIARWQADHDLTEAETTAILVEQLAGAVGGIAKYQIRFERHGDYDKPGGWE